MEENLHSVCVVCGVNDKKRKEERNKEMKLNRDEDLTMRKYAKKNNVQTSGLSVP